MIQIWQPSNCRYVVIADFRLLNFSCVLLNLAILSYFSHHTLLVQVKQLWTLACDTK